MYVDDIKLAGKKRNIDPMWKLLNKEVDLGEPTSSLDHVYLGCRERKTAGCGRHNGSGMGRTVVAFLDGLRQVLRDGGFLHVEVKEVRVTL